MYQVELALPARTLLLLDWQRLVIVTSIGDHRPCSGHDLMSLLQLLL